MITRTLLRRSTEELSTPRKLAKVSAQGKVPLCLNDVLRGQSFSRIICLPDLPSTSSDIQDDTIHGTQRHSDDKVAT